MGRAQVVFDQLQRMFEAGEVGGIPELYTADAVYLEPGNPPHNGNLLIEAYLKDWLGGKEELTVSTKRALESADGLSIALEWSVSYTAAGRRWNNLARATFLELNEAGMVVYQRDYA